MRILFLSHYFRPEVNAPAQRTFALCSSWVAAGHEVHVVTGVPNHPRGRPFSGHRNAWYRQVRISGVHVHRVWTYLAPNRGRFRRTACYLSYVPTATWRALRTGPFDVVVATSPQFFCALAGRIGSSLLGVPWVFDLRDLWPESIRAVGALRNGPVLRALERLELHLYRHARAVVCVARPFVETLAERGIPREKLHYVPNSVDAPFWDEADRAATRESLGVGPDEFLVGYVGTVGMAHGLDSLLEAAAVAARERPKLRFVVVGDGAELAALRERAASQGRRNLQFLGLVDRERARDVLVACDAALVLLRRAEVFTQVLPSKLLEAMAARVAVVLGVEGEARRVLDDAGAGLAVPPQDPEALYGALQRLAEDRALRDRFGANGRRYVETKFPRERWARAYLDLLSSVADGSCLEPAAAIR